MCTTGRKKTGSCRKSPPYGGVDFYMSFMDGSVGWADAGVLIPYRFWKLYGDDSLIRRHYDGMVRYARFMIKRCTQFTPLRHHLPLKGEAKKYIVNYGHSYGEWAEPADVFPNDWKNIVLPHPKESTAYTVFIMEHMMEIAGYWGKQQDKALFEKYRDGCTKAYRELITLPAYTLDTNRQAKLVRPLYLRLLDEKQEAFAKHRLVQAMENYRWRLGTGFLSTPFILDVLADMDENHVSGGGSTAAKGYGGKKDYDNPNFRMQMASSAGAPIRSMIISGGMKGGRAAWYAGNGERALLPRHLENAHSVRKCQVYTPA